MHLTPKGCVAIRFKMHTYCVYAPLLNRIDGLPLGVIYYFAYINRTLCVFGPWREAFSPLHFTDRFAENFDNPQSAAGLLPGLKCGLSICEIGCCFEGP